ncbi:MAG: protease [Mycobacterium sp.]|jgi:protease I|nr:protease [Pseudonocardiales bacterium]MDT5080234.1 protease [Mycobacterium sp.]
MNLNGVRVALLIEDEYQILEGWYPHLRLQEAGATVTVVGNGLKDTFESKEHYPMRADVGAPDADPADFDAVIVPGGFAPDNMRLHPEMIDFVRKIHQAGKLTASICHGGWVLISAGALKGRKATGYAPIRDDVVNAGGTWLDQAVVEDGNVITARTPVDLPQFLAAIIDYLGREVAAKSGAGHLEAANA